MGQALRDRDALTHLLEEEKRASADLRTALGALQGVNDSLGVQVGNLQSSVARLEEDKHGIM